MSRLLSHPTFSLLAVGILYSSALTACAVESSTKSKTSSSSKSKTSSNSSSKPKSSQQTGLNGVPNIHAASAVVIDANSGKVLHSVNADDQRAVASTQKLMTALLVAEGGDLDKKVRIEASDTWAEPSKLDIKAGEIYRRGDLLKILLVKSMNDVARALARDNAGSVEAFARKMNERAEELGMKNTLFVNPNGLPAKGQHSCARDMAKLAAAAYRVRAIREIVCLKELHWEHPNGQVTEYHNTNKVLSSLSSCNGMKTGYTQAAGFCLVSSASSGGKDVISVVLGDAKEYVWSDSQRLLVWGLGPDKTAANNP